MIDSKTGVVIAVIYGIVETLEKFGVARKYAHLIALPLGVLCSFLFLEFSSPSEYILNGLLFGLVSVGSCDTFCNIVNSIKEKKNE